MKVENLVAIELAYINTKHPDFQSNASLVSSFLGEEEKTRNIPVRRSHGNAPSTYEQEMREQSKVSSVKIYWIAKETSVKKSFLVYIILLDTHVQLLYLSVRNSMQQGTSLQTFVKAINFYF